MNLENIPTAEIEYLAGSDALRAVFDELEADALEELLRLPFWASRRRKDGLVLKIQIMREVRDRIALLKALRRPRGPQVV